MFIHWQLLNHFIIFIEVDLNIVPCPKTYFSTIDEQYKHGICPDSIGGSNSSTIQNNNLKFWVMMDLKKIEFIMCFYIACKIIAQDRWALSSRDQGMQKWLLYFPIFSHSNHHSFCSLRHSFCTSWSLLCVEYASELWCMCVSFSFLFQFISNLFS